MSDFDVLMCDKVTEDFCSLNKLESLIKVSRESYMN